MTKSNEFEVTARALVAKGKGLLAADESFPTIQKRFAALNIESTEENRRAYREVLFTTTGIENYISGVIMFDETIRQKTRDGKSFVELLNRKGVFPGIKVDKGTLDMPGFPGEKLTAGLDGLRERLKEYRDLGARFTKWRAVITIGSGIPTRLNINTNARTLALFAALSQEANMTPVVEPEVLMDGDHDINRCEEVSVEVLDDVFSALREYHVHLEGMLLKASMVLPGKNSPNQVQASQVAETTLRTLRRVVPAAVPGIVFLSGGQSPEQATRHLNAMNALGNHPWEISFSFARALQDPVLKTWMGAASNAAAAQKKFYHRAKCNSEARYGTYSEEAEKTA
ncbi:MAG TPA: class I fructose-bisphosphate aldolase [Nitrospirota bacterium]|nr:class I fructose-bisphosphate aldolase [Nitrospirota bacterium]